MKVSLSLLSVFLIVCHDAVVAETVARPSTAPVATANEHKNTNNKLEGSRKRPAPPPPRWLRSLKVTPIALEKEQVQEPEASTATATTATSVDNPITSSPHPSHHHHAAMSKRTRQRFITAVSFLAGFTDAFSFKKYETYATMMTGNVIRTAMMIAEFKFKRALFFVSLYIPYLSGHFVYRAKDLQMKTTNALREQLGQPKIPTYLAVIPYFLFAFVLCDIFPVRRSLALKMPLMAFGYSIINAAAGDATSGVTTSAMTGHTETLGLSLADYHLVDQKWRKGSKTSMRVISSFLTGIMVSATGANYVLPFLQRHGWPSFPLPFEMTVGLLHALVFQWYGNQWMAMQAMSSMKDDTTATTTVPPVMETEATPSTTRRNLYDDNNNSNRNDNTHRGRNNNNNSSSNNHNNREKKVAAPPRPTSHHRERKIPPPARPKERRMPPPKRKIHRHTENEDYSEDEFV
mmetsp:Transcript_18264/g.25735  ORF Transcript_18264/g.25735 Transcript_18264/m.25735 type:complete len:461 (+) Transcript_18264:254-1636(+)